MLNKMKAKLLFKQSQPRIAYWSQQAKELNWPEEPQWTLLIGLAENAIANLQKQFVHIDSITLGGIYSGPDLVSRPLSYQDPTDFYRSVLKDMNAARSQTESRGLHLDFSRIELVYSRFPLSHLRFEIRYTGDAHCPIQIIYGY